jgi:hypothetical protein
MPFKDILDLETQSAKGYDKQQGNKIAAAFLMMQTEDGDVGKNHGTLCPPPACDADILKMAEEPE